MSTRVDEIAERIYRINTPTEIPGGGAFSFNQYLIVDDEPLLFHTGLAAHVSRRARGDRARHAGRAPEATWRCRTSRPMSAAR